MKKILYIANLRLPTEKAYGIQIVEMCQAFSGAGLDVALIYPYRRNPSGKSIFDYYQIVKKFRADVVPAVDFYFPGRLDKISVMVKNLVSGFLLAWRGLFSNADIIYSRDELPLFFLSFFKKNLVFEAHRFSPKRTLFYNKFKHKGVKAVVISEAIRKEFLKLGFDSRNILVAHDGVDLDEFDLPFFRAEARNKTGLPIDKKIVMYTGHLFDWKGADTLLQAAKLISNSQFLISNKEKILFIFVGGTDYDVKKFKEKAEGLANVLILGHKPHNEIPIFLKAADVLVLPNSAGDKISGYTSPLKLFEYMASGCPVVASRLPSISEILNDGNAVLVRPDDSGRLAEGIKKILDDNMLGQKIAEKARQDVENYTWQKRAEKIIDFLA